MDGLAESGGVEVLTVNGEAKGVVMSPQAFDELAEKAHQAEITAKIRRGMAEIQAGQGIDARQAMGQLADKHGLNIDR